uniref:Ovule protein n=1 Tax=Heterorhabditis bacteriophora TaxID=37862 RepID=A0A1I7X0L9_HETBA
MDYERPRSLVRHRPGWRCEYGDLFNLMYNLIHLNYGDHNELWLTALACSRTSDITKCCLFLYSAFLFTNFTILYFLSI